MVTSPEHPSILLAVEVDGPLRGLLSQKLSGSATEQPLEKGDCTMTSRRRVRVSRARRQRQEEDRLRACEQRAETSRKTTVLFRYMLLGLGMAVFVISLVGFVSAAPSLPSPPDLRKRRS